jgi:lysozyme
MAAAVSPVRSRDAGSIVTPATCGADYREDPQIPYAWADRGWRLWQYAADETEANFAYGAPSRAVAGVGHCDRNLFAGDEVELYRFWKGKTGTT